MVKKVFIVIMVVALCIVSGYKILQWKRANADDVFAPVKDEQVVAIYSHNVIKLGSEIKSNYSLKWINNSAGALPVDKLKEILKSAQPIFINLEIYPGELIKKLDKKVPESILEHRFDEKLTAFGKILTGTSSTIYIRYNGEMELPVYKFPWQNQGGTQYILSFRYIHDLLKKLAPNVKMVWGPTGYPGADEYWPGNEYVDYCSVTLRGAADISPDNFPGYKDDADMIKRKLFRMRFFEKGVLLLSSSNKTTITEQSLSTVNEELYKDSIFYHTVSVPLNTDTTTDRGRRDSNLIVGVYDPKLKLVNQPLVTVEHIFTDMKSIQNGVFKRDFDSVLMRHHNVIVTFEPWRDKYREKDPDLMTNIIKGKYDTVIAQLYQIISNIPQTIYLRWGHEMEIPVDRYAWQKQDPVAYIKAFRYVANFNKQKAPNIKMIWGPAGDRGSLEWWPGEDVVDYISIAIYGLPDKNINDHTKQLSFSQIFRIKFHRMRFAHKPIFITEFGVKGPEEYKMKWLEDAAWAINKYPEVKGINYFNFADVPKAWGDAETPDWSITPATFKTFTSLLKDTPHQ